MNLRFDPLTLLFFVVFACGASASEAAAVSPIRLGIPAKESSISWILPLDEDSKTGELAILMRRNNVIHLKTQKVLLKVDGISGAVDVFITRDDGEYRLTYVPDQPAHNLISVSHRPRFMGELDSDKFIEYLFSMGLVLHAPEKRQKVDVPSTTPPSSPK